MIQLYPCCNLPLCCMFVPIYSKNYNIFWWNQELKLLKEIGTVILQSFLEWQCDKGDWCVKKC